MKTPLSVPCAPHLPSLLLSTTRAGGGDLGGGHEVTDVLLKEFVVVV